MSLCKIKLTNKFSSVNDKIFSLKMKPLTRLTLAWALGRPDGWEFNLSFLKSQLSISEAQWRGIKKELIPAGFFSQTNERNEKGHPNWINNFHDTPLFLESTPLKTTGGKTTGGKTTGGKSTSGKHGGKQKEVEAKNLNRVLKTTTQSLVVVFLEAAENPVELVGHEKTFGKHLEGATLSQANLAGLAYKKSTVDSNHVGLAVNLCKAAAVGRVNLGKKEEEAEKASVINQQSQRMKTLAGKKFVNPAGEVFKIFSESIVLVVNDPKDERAWVGAKAYPLLKKIDSGEWQLIN